MKRDYKDGIKSHVDFFVGDEVERTPARGKRTLFVVGLCTIDVVKQKIAEANAILNQDFLRFNLNVPVDPIEHIYLGANMSFDPGNWQGGEHLISDAWTTLINETLAIGLPTTLDFDIKHIEWVCDGCFAENSLFIPQLSVKIPYLSQLGYNATLKIDDKDFNASNPGVWCHSLHSLTHRAGFTSWDKYKGDTIL